MLIIQVWQSFRDLVQKDLFLNTHSVPNSARLEKTSGHKHTELDVQAWKPAMSIQVDNSSEGERQDVWTLLDPCEPERGRKTSPRKEQQNRDLKNDQALGRNVSGHRCSVGFTCFYYFTCHPPAHVSEKRIFGSHLPPAPTVFHEITNNILIWMPQGSLT